MNHKEKGRIAPAASRRLFQDVASSPRWHCCPWSMHALCQGRRRIPDTTPLPGNAVAARQRVGRAGHTDGDRPETVSRETSGGRSTTWAWRRSISDALTLSTSAAASREPRNHDRERDRQTARSRHELRLLHSGVAATNRGSDPEGDRLSRLSLHYDGLPEFGAKPHRFIRDSTTMPVRRHVVLNA